MKATSNLNGSLKSFLNCSSSTKEYSDNSGSETKESGEYSDSGEERCLPLSSFSTAFKRHDEQGNYSSARRKYESKIRLKRDPDSLREDCKNRQKNLRKQMKDLFQQLALSIRPPLNPQDSTKAILQKAVDYIKHLHTIIDSYELEAKNSKQPQSSNNETTQVNNPFNQPNEIFFNGITPEAEREFENILFTSSNTSNLLGEELTFQKMNFDAPINNTEIDNLLSLPSSPSMFDLSSSPIKTESDLFNLSSDHFLDNSLFPSNKYQKTEQLHSSSKNDTNLLDLDTFGSSKQTNYNFNDFQTQFQQYSNSSLPLLPTPSFYGDGTNPSFQPLWPNSTPTSSFNHPSSNSYSSSSIPPLLKQENIVPSFPISFSSPNSNQPKTQKLDEKSVLNAFEKLELKNKK